MPTCTHRGLHRPLFLVLPGYLWGQSVSGLWCLQSHLYDLDKPQSLAHPSGHLWKFPIWELWLAQHIAVGVWCLNALYVWHNILLWECYVQILFVNIYKTFKTHSVSKVSAITFGNNEPCDLHVFWKDHCLVGPLSCIFKSDCRRSLSREWLNQKIKNNFSSVQSHSASQNCK